MTNSPQRPTLDAILAVTRGADRGSQGGGRPSSSGGPQPAPAVRRLQAPTDAVGLIAEVKRRSPSQGDIRTDLDPVQHARAYVRGGRRGRFGAHGRSALWRITRRSRARLRQPYRCRSCAKDFILDELQIMEARGGRSECDTPHCASAGPGHTPGPRAGSSRMALADADRGSLGCGTRAGAGRRAGCDRRETRETSRHSPSICGGRKP